MNSVSKEFIPVAECVKHFESTKHTKSTETSEVAAESLDGFRYRSRWRGLWIGAAFVPLMFLAGILILVETKKGRLVIESEVAGVNVTLLRDGEIYDELKLEPGTNSTTLLAGQYKIVVDDAKDIVLLDGGKIEIKWGDVVVARVRPEPKQLTEAEFENVEPIYDGKGVGEWLDIVARERNATKARTALVAVKSLLNPENAPLISKRLVQVMATLSDDLAQSRAVIETSSVPQRGTTQSVRYSSTMDELGFSILRNSSSRDDFARLLVHELDQGKLAWQKRILKHASSMVTVDGLQELEAILQRHYPNTSVTVLPNQKGCSINGFVPSGNDVEHILALAEQYFQPVVNRLTVSGENSNPPESNVNKEEPTSSTASQDYLPIIEWIEHKVINAGQDDELLHVCADYYWELISHAYTDEAIKLSLLQKLAGCQALGPEFWLAVKRLGDTQQSWQQPWQSTGPHSTLHPAARMEIEKQAIATLAMPEGRSPFQVQAAIILRQLFSKNFDRHGMADTRAVLLEQIRSLLRRLGNTQHELLAADAIPNSLVNMTALVNEINSQSKLEILKPSGELRYYSWVIGRFSPAQSFLTIELLELIRTMDASSEFSSELLKLYKTTAELNDQLSAILDTNPINEVMWPGLVSKPASPATTDQWIAGLIRARAFRLLALETQAELTQLANRTFQSRAFESLLDKYDLNKDRVLSVKEASNLPESSLPAPSENLDLNGNGTLEEIELKDLLLRLGSQPALGKVQAVAPNEVVQQWSIKQIEKFDRNKDGRLTADEWRVMIIKIDDADTNADGVITAEELAIFRSRKQ